MTAAGNAKRKKWAIIKRSGGYFRGKNKPITGIDRGVLLEPEVGFVILDHPVRFEITGKLKDVTVFIQLSFGSFSLFLFFFQFLLAEGMTGRLNQAGVDGYAFIDDKPLPGELLKNDLDGMKTMLLRQCGRLRNNG